MSDRKIFAEYLTKITSMTIPRVSILLPTFNRGDFISACIEDVLRQNYFEWELIILDDCSNDTTREVCENYAHIHPTIRYHRNDRRLGTPANRNVGLSLAQCGLVFFIEDDILLDPDCLKILVETYDQIKEGDGRIAGVIPRLINDGTEFAHSDTCQPFILNQWTGDIQNNYSIICDHVIETFTAHACTLYSKDVLLAVGGYAEIYRGNFFREETEPPMRMVERGYRLYYQSLAFAYHKNYGVGSYRGLRWSLSQYFTIRNHMIFLFHIFGIRAFYMGPLFVFGMILGVFHKCCNFYKPCIR